MEIAALIALASQKLSELDAICPPEDIRDAACVGASLKTVENLVTSIRAHIKAIEHKFNNQLFDDGVLSQTLGENHRTIFVERLKSRLPALDQAFKVLDPAMAEFEVIVDSVVKTTGKVNFTFEVAIQRIFELISENPELESSFDVESADKFLESALIKFDPDSWLYNANQLSPIVARGKNHKIPVQLKFRLREIFRSFIFGNHISVLCLARAALEYTIHDNLSRFGIDPTYQVTRPKPETRKKNLEQLIDEIGEYLPARKENMHWIRQNGNDFIHPDKSLTKRNQLFDRKRKAQSSVQETVAIISEIYGFQSSH